MDISKLSLEQLKALAYDELVKKDIAINNINALNKEIRLKEAKGVVQKVKK